MAGVGTKGKRQFQALGEVIPFVGTVTLTAAAGAETQSSVTVGGAENGDIVLWGVEEDLEGGVLSANVNVAGAVEFTFANATASTITIAAGTVVNGLVIKPNGNPFKELGT